jgi:hypothetical protein
MRVVLERGFLGENWRFGADGTLAFTGRLDEALNLLIRSASASPEAAPGLPGFLEQAQWDGFSACLVVLPPTPGVWVPAVVSSLENARLRIHAFTVVDGLTIASHTGRDWKKLLYVHKAGAGERAFDLAWMARSFGPSRSPLFVIDRTAGTVIGDVRSLSPHKKSAQGGRS